jgi:sugar phosphate isomerase/epimerase
MNRREFLATTAALTSISQAARPAAARRVALGANVILPNAEPVRTMQGQVGYRETDDPEVLAQAHKKLGYTAAFCPAGKAGDAARVRAIRKAFAGAGVLLAEVGAWDNMMNPDAAARKRAIEYNIQQMAFADELEARCCVNVAGSFDGATLSGPHPKNLSKEFFDATVENCRKIIDTVKPKRSKYSIEMKGWNIPDGPDSYLALIKAVDRPAFGVHMDICNAINSPVRYYNSGAFIEETFQKLGKWVLSCHGKDLKWIPEQNVHFLEVPPGQGGVDYRAYLREISKTGAPLLLEHFLTNGEFQDGARYVRKIGAEIGVEVGYNGA